MTPILAPRLCFWLFISLLAGFGAHAQTATVASPSLVSGTNVNSSFGKMGVGGGLSKSPKDVAERMIGVMPAAPSPTNSGGMPFDVNAGNLQYDVNAGKMEATGGVEVTGPQGRIRSDKMTYDVSSNIIVAEGNVIYTDQASNALMVDRLELTGELQKGVAERLRLAMPNLGEVMTASSATKVSATQYVMKDVSYSPCRTCPGERKPWQINAETLEYDQAEGELTYRNATMDVYGVPVLYLPYFNHPVGTPRPKNGLLMPQFGTSTALGQQVTLGAYYYNSPTNADYTFRTRVMTERGVQLQAERRQVTESTESEIRGSYLNDQGNGKVRSHLYVAGDKVLQPGRRIGVNAEITSDDNYLNEYFGRTDPYLGSTVYGEDASEDHYYGLSMTRFQDLDPTRDPAETAQVLPHLELQRMFSLGDDGSQLLLTADSLNLSRDLGPRYRRALGMAEYTKPVLLDDGSRVTLGASARADFYNVDGSTDNGNATRFLPEVTAKWEKPYISPGGYHTIAPTVMAALAPRGGNPEGIPNEDSVAYELDSSNLFEPSRFAGLDRVETGPRLTYGLDNRWGSPDATDWRLFVGQSIRKYDELALPQAGGAATTTSDWVGYAEASPVPWFGLSQRFRLDNATFNVRRLDSQLRLGEMDKTRLLTTYTYLDNGPAELTGDFRSPFNEHVTFLGRLRRDMVDERLLLGEAGVILHRDCYEIELLARRRGYESGDLQPSTDYLVNVRLLTLGGEQ